MLKVCQPLPDRIGVDSEVGSNLLGAEPAAFPKNGQDENALAGGELTHSGCGVLACAWISAPGMSYRGKVD